MAVNTCLIVGGTHGNETSGLCLLNPSIKRQLSTTFKTLSLYFEIGNPNAVRNNVRFTEDDLNRQFTLNNLADQTAPRCYEKQRAQWLDKEWGPKSSPSIDLVIDIHNTTSAMGATLIILTLDAFHIGLARYVKTHMPHANILVEDEKPVSEHPYLCTIGKAGVMVEVGAQPQGVCREDIAKLALEQTQRVLEYCELYNSNAAEIKNLQSVEAYRLTGTCFFPENRTTGHSTREWLIHPKLQDNDFSALNKGNPVFITLDGDVVEWEKDITFPHFVNEAAYHKSNIAFATADKIAI